MSETHLKKGDQLHVPGGTITLTSPNRCRVEISPDVPYLRDKAYMPEKEATTDTRQIYFHLQEAYLATSDFARNSHLQECSNLAGRLVDGNRSLLHFVERIDGALEEGNYFEALKAAKDLYDFEDRSLSADFDGDPSP